MTKCSRPHHAGSELDGSSSNEDSYKGQRSKHRDEDYGRGIKIKGLNAAKDMKNSSKNWIANRLRRRNEISERKINLDDDSHPQTRGSNRINNHDNTDNLNINRSVNKRELKWISKHEEDSKSYHNEESKQLDYSKRVKYFNRGNTVYKEYDDFLKKRKKDRKVEFIKNTLEPGEEIIKAKDSKLIQKFFGGPSADQDTFCYWNTGSYDEMIAWDNPKWPIEWFHFAWVGLDSKPTTLWFCKWWQKKKK